jgi:hypothetical protein
MSCTADSIVVIRSAGERTKEACRSLVEADVRPENVVVIEERPFEEALRRSFELGISSGARWLVTVDADLLLRAGAVEDMIACAISLTNDVFQIQPRIHDKFILGYRTAGPRVYRVSMLDEAVSLIPLPGEKLRPEAHVVQAMGQAGRRTVALPMVVGIHDYEQYYRDIYRKCYVHGHKFVKWIPAVLPDWKARARDDLDYWVALHGLWRGLMSRDGVRLDIEAFPKSVEDILISVDAAEKSPLDAEEIGPVYVESCLARAGTPPRRLTRSERLRALRGRVGWVRTATWGLGWGLARLGLSIQSLSDSNVPDRA